MRKAENLSDMIFGRLRVIKRDDSPCYNKPHWICKCECGKIKTISAANLKSGNTISCGCYRIENGTKTNAINLENKQFGKLTVIKFHHSIKRKGFYWECLCDCGNEVIALSTKLISGITTSCGCSNESPLATNLKKHCVENYGAKIEYSEFKNPETNRPLKYDIYLPKEKIFIEVNGSQHYIKKEGWDTDYDFKRRKYLDGLKRRYAKKNGLFIEIDLRKIKNAEQAIEKIEKIIKRKVLK